jgi:hypothetical protein
MSHTPGPWTWAQGKEYADGRDFPSVYMGPESSEIGGNTMDEADANARLIAAAPDLLAGLCHMRWCRSCSEGDWNDCEGGRAALAAIAKAEPDVHAASSAGEKQ